MRVSLSENQEIEIFSSSRPDMRLDYVKPIRTGDYSVENGILWTTLVNRISGNELQRAFAILELNKAENKIEMVLKEDDEYGEIVPFINEEEE
jgi:hypothetical protein